jgi:ankyrin repeat protein
LSWKPVLISSYIYREIFKYLLSKGLNVNETGHIGFSNKRKNSLISNVIGAASLHGRSQLLKYLIQNFPKLDINFKTIEKLDYKGKSPLVKEFNGYNPIFLSVTQGDKGHTEAVKALIDAKADSLAVDQNDNTLLHIAS